MHLCFLCAEYPPAVHGGIGTFTQLMARWLAARGHEVTIVGTYAELATDVHERDGAVRVVRLAARGGRGIGIWRDARQLRNALRAINDASTIDILEGSEMSFAWLARVGRAKRVVRLHGGHHFFAAAQGHSPRFFRAWAERRSLARADHICAVSAHVARETHRLVPLGRTAMHGHRHESEGDDGRPPTGASAVDVCVLPNFVDTAEFAPRAVELVEERVQFVGTLCHKKGVPELLAAMPTVIASHAAATLVLTGRDTRDSRTGASYIEALVRGLPVAVAARVVVRGALPHHAVAHELASAAVCVFPSHAESFGIACLEAMSMGKACIVSSAGPGAELVEHEHSGLLVPPRDPRALAAAILRVLHDHDLQQRLGRAARERALAHFSADVVVPRNVAFYARCLAAALR